MNDTNVINMQAKARLIREAQAAREKLKAERDFQSTGIGKSNAMRMEAKNQPIPADATSFVIGGKARNEKPAHPGGIDDMEI